MEDVSVYTPDELKRREELKKRLLTEFQEDLLFRVIAERGWVDELFDDSFLSIHVDQTYSVMEAVPYVGANHGQDIRNVFRSLKHYIRPDDSAGAMRLDYKAMFRLKMVFFLKREFTLPALERLLSGLPVEYEEEVIMPDIVRRLIVEQDRKMNAIMDMIATMSQKMQEQTLMLQSGSEKERQLEAEIQRLKETQEQLLEKVNELHRQNASQYKEVLDKINRDEQWNELKETIAELRKSEDRDQQIMSYLRMLQEDKQQKKGFWSRIFRS